MFGGGFEKYKYILKVPGVPFDTNVPFWIDFVIIKWHSFI